MMSTSAGTDMFAFSGIDLPRPSWRPPEPIMRRALIDGAYRRWLYRGWSSGPCAFWGMLNPSEASAERDDPTLWQIMKISFRLGFGSLYVGNVYPYISSSPAEMRRWRASFASHLVEPDYEAHAAFVRNHADVADLCQRCEGHFAAWGDGAADIDDVVAFLEGSRGPNLRLIEWKCFGRNASGSPKHPLARGRHRIPDDALPVLWIPPRRLQ